MQRILTLDVKSCLSHISKRLAAVVVVKCGLKILRRLGQVPLGEDLEEDSGHAGGIVSWLAWEGLWIHVEELAQVAGQREVWASLLNLLP